MHHGLELEVQFLFLAFGRAETGDAYLGQREAVGDPGQGFVELEQTHLEHPVLVQFVYLGLDGQVEGQVDVLFLQQGV